MVSTWLTALIFSCLASSLSTHHVKSVSACTETSLIAWSWSKIQLWHYNLLVWSYRLHWIENNPTRTWNISALIVRGDTKAYYINQLVSSTPMRRVTNRAGPTKWERRASLWRWTFWNLSTNEPKLQSACFSETPGGEGESYAGGSADISGGGRYNFMPIKKKVLEGFSHLRFSSLGDRWCHSAAQKLVLVI